MRWVCPSCGYANEGGAVCDACGLARRFLEDPPLDMPRQPRWSELGASYAFGAYALLAAGGLLVLLLPEVRAAVGVGGPWLAVEIALAAAAAFGSGREAAWQRRFHRAELRVPAGVRSGRPFGAVLALVPYQRLGNLWVRLELVERVVEQVRWGGRRGARARAQVLARWDLDRAAPLPGRRRHEFGTELPGPPPSILHSTVHAEILASVLGFLGHIVPGLGHQARNLRQHGGYYVRARVRSGWQRRTFERQVVSVAVPAGLEAASSAAHPPARPASQR